MNRPMRFVDAGYWIALVNRGDKYHETARALNRRLRGPFMTTEAVLFEVGNALSRLRWRSLGVSLLTEVLIDPTFDVVSVSTDLFSRAFSLYQSRPDKEWGLTDCVSFVVMRDHGVTEALAADQHVVQAGFRALLRE